MSDGVTPKYVRFVAMTGTTHLTEEGRKSLCGTADVPDTSSLDSLPLPAIENYHDGSAVFCARCARIAINDLRPDDDS